jgi:hypothetical protein
MELAVLSKSGQHRIGHRAVFLKMRGMCPRPAPLRPDRSYVANGDAIWSNDAFAFFVGPMRA